MKLLDALKIYPQYALPHHALSQLMSHLTHSRNPVWKNLFIKTICQIYGVNLAEAAESDIKAYANFNEFFTRPLKAGVRPVDSARHAIVSPADGAISQCGTIEQGCILQAKGQSFSAEELLGGSERAASFMNGRFATIYLSPKDYHRLHMPFGGTLREMIHIPGRLFSVNQVTTENVPRLFARNERVVCLFDTTIGPMALVLVGAIFVSSIETLWHGVVTPPTQHGIRSWKYEDVNLEKGQEMGRFNMGSTIIVLFGRDAMQWQNRMTPGTVLKMGEAIGSSL